MIDEVETVLRARRDVRGKVLNGLRQILDASDRFPGLLWVFTGTPEFFDTPRGVAGLDTLEKVSWVVASPVERKYIGLLLRVGCRRLTVEDAKLIRAAAKARSGAGSAS